jgi:hypothetical protein
MGGRMEEQFLFGDDQEKQKRDRENERRSRVYGTPEFHVAYAQYIQSLEWKKLCKLVKERAPTHRGSRESSPGENSMPDAICV